MTFTFYYYNSIISIYGTVDDFDWNEPTEWKCSADEVLQLHLGMTSVLFFQVTNQQPADRHNLQQSNELILHFYYLLPKKEILLHPKKHIH